MDFGAGFLMKKVRCQIAGAGTLAASHVSKIEAVKKPSSITPEKERGLVRGCGNWRGSLMGARSFLISVSSLRV